MGAKRGPTGPLARTRMAIKENSKIPVFIIPTGCLKSRTRHYIGFAVAVRPEGVALPKQEVACASRICHSVYGAAKTRTCQN